jgi:hypothetical protein
MIPDAVAVWLRRAIGSFWTLETLLTLHRDTERAWTEAELVRETRSSAAAIAGALARLRAQQVAADGGDGRWRFAPATAEIEACVAAVAEAYATEPVALVRIVLTAPDEKLRNFADAFRLRKD